MSCPTCEHTMSNLGIDQAGRKVFWCPRCGTLRTETRATLSAGTFEEYEAPALVARVEKLLKITPGDSPGVRAVKESIGLYRNNFGL